MKILFVSQWTAIRELGGPKVVIELAEEMEGLGWSSTVKSIVEIHEEFGEGGRLTKAQALRVFLRKNAAVYDVVDYDHVYLPFPRHDFPDRTLFVARSVLLAHLIREVKIPKPRSLKLLVSSVIRWKQTWRERKVFRDADLTVKAADLINVPTSTDRETLIRHGVHPEKIVVHPYGIDTKRRALFDAMSENPPMRPKIAFVGTFDFRKGCLDIPKIVATVLSKVPTATFKLLGVAGMYQAESKIRECFPSKLHNSLEIIMRYKASELPHLLTDCSIGIFPSYLEGFGFGVIEMLAACIPVFAYNSPGPSSILPPSFLTPPGDIHLISQRAADLLNNEEKLRLERKQARLHSRAFNWRAIAINTDTAYRARIPGKI